MIGSPALRKFASAILLAMLCSACFGQEVFPFSELKFQGLFGTRAGDKTLYCLLGNGFIRSIRSEEDPVIVSEWRAQHPAAKAVPVGILGEGSRMRIVYVWAVDGDDSLNLLLIKKGAFPASVMLDPVQFFQLSKNAPQPPGRAEGLAYGQKLSNAPPEVEIPPRRLVPDARYKAFLKQLVAAEAAAQLHASGIWSDKFKDLRDTEEVTPLGSLPRAVLGY